MFERLKQYSQLVTYKELRNGLLGMSVVIGGLALAGLTLFAHIQNNTRLAGIAASASLAFVALIIIFVIPPLARNASAEASQLNLPFEFTTGGAIFIGLLVIVAFAAWNTANNLLFLVLSFISAALIVSFLIGHFALKRLDVKMRFPETVYANEPTPIVLSLHSRKRFLPTFSVTAEVRGRRPYPEDLKIRLREFLPDGWAERIARPPILKHTLDYFLHIPRRGSIENEVEHVFEQYGRFQIKDFELSTRFPLSFFRHRRRLPAQRADLVVFPEPVEVDSDLISFGAESGSTTSRRRGIGRDLIGMREYQPLDDLRSIDWKATARTSRMIVRDFASEDDLKVIVVFDSRIRLSDKDRKRTIREQIDESQQSLHTGESVDRFETGAGKAVFLLNSLYEREAEIGLFTIDGEVEVDQGRSHLFECQRAISTVMPAFVEEFENGEFDERLAEFLDNNPEAFCYFLRFDGSSIRYPESERSEVIGY